MSPSAHASARLSRGSGGRVNTATALAISIAVIVLRLPSAEQSFWVDELHSAWTIWGEFEEVAPRANAGNQLPLYFWALWLWKAIAGSSEVALRFSSIVCVVVSCLVLCSWTIKSQRVLGPGLIAAALLAVERNSIFYGTELRPYAAIVLCSSIAVVALWQMLNTHHWWPRLALAVAVAAAVLLQPATLLPFLALPATCYVFCRHTSALRARDLWILPIAVVVPLLVSAGTLQRLWRSRGQWHEFAVPSGLLDLWLIWPWLPLVIVPLVSLLVAKRLASDRSGDGKPLSDSAVQSRALRFAFANLSAVVGCVVLIWLMAAAGLLPLWHRRYLIACLPMLCAASGGIWSHVYFEARRIPAVHRVSGSAGAIVLLTAVLLVITFQGIRLGELPVVNRGEDWRGAVRFVRSSRAPGESVLIAAQLIESRGFDGEAVVQQSDEELAQYLRFPVAGPYPLPQARPAGSSTQTWQRLLRNALRRNRNAAATDDDPPVAWLIARVPKSSAVAFSELLEQYNGGIEVVVREFGNVAVIRASGTR